MSLHTTSLNYALPISALWPATQSYALEFEHLFTRPVRPDVGGTLVFPGRELQPHGRPYRRDQLVAIGRRLAEARGVDAQQDRRHRGAFGEVQPFEMADMIVAAALGKQMPAAVPFAQIFGDSARFDDDAILVLDYRRFAERMDGDQFGRGEIGDRIAVVIFDLIGCADFLEQP